MNTANEEKNRQWLELRMKLKRIVADFEAKEKRDGTPSPKEIVDHSLQLKELVTKLGKFEGNG